MRLSNLSIARYHHGALLTEDARDEAVRRIAKRLALIVQYRRHHGSTPADPDMIGADPRLVVATHLAEIDPTPRHIYAAWITRLYNSGRIAIKWLDVNGMTWLLLPAGDEAEGNIEMANFYFILPEDKRRVREVFTKYEKLKPRLPPEQRDIGRIDSFYDLEDLVDNGAAQTSFDDLDIETMKNAGVEIMKEGDWLVFRVPQLEHDDGEDFYEGDSHGETNLERVNALAELGEGTKWCTRASYPECAAADYLGENDVFVFYYQGKPVFQGHIETDHRHRGAFANPNRDIAVTMLDARDRKPDNPILVNAATDMLRALKERVPAMAPFHNYMAGILWYQIKDRHERP